MQLKSRVHASRQEIKKWFRLVSKIIVQVEEQTSKIDEGTTIAEGGTSSPHRPCLTTADAMLLVLVLLLPCWEIANSEKENENIEPAKSVLLYRTHLRRQIFLETEFSSLFIELENALMTCVRLLPYCNI